ncbi:hypothetical protein TNCV_2531251 [Trichonephila clavipes]|nr:hypothetical protein TNCV_2531251 [Trichonephila clavipes]
MVDFHKRILFSDEAHFWLNGYVNKQNCRIWSEANPQVYVETPLHPEKLTVGHRAASSHVRLVEGEESWEASDYPQEVLPESWGETELKIVLWCSRLRKMTGIHLAPCRDDFHYPGSDAVKIRWHKKQQQSFPR